MVVSNRFKPTNQMRTFLRMQFSIPAVSHSFALFSFQGMNSGWKPIIVNFQLSIFNSRRRRAVGVDGGEGTPVPIPNTAVKLTCAHDTRLATARENRWMPTPPQIKPPP